jgi:hypothetical protein
VVYLTERRSKPILKCSLIIYCFDKPSCFFSKIENVVQVGQARSFPKHYRSWEINKNINKKSLGRNGVFLSRLIVERPVDTNVFTPIRTLHVCTKELHTSNWSHPSVVPLVIVRTQHLSWGNPSNFSQLQVVGLSVLREWVSLTSILILSTSYLTTTDQKVHT